MQQGVDLALTLGLQEVQTESDCLLVIKAINSTTTCLSLGGHIVEDVKQKAFLFNSISFFMFFVRQILWPMILLNQLLVTEMG